MANPQVKTTVGGMNCEEQYIEKNRLLRLNWVVAIRRQHLSGRSCFARGSPPPSPGYPGSPGYPRLPTCRRASPPGELTPRTPGAGTSLAGAPHSARTGTESLASTERPPLSTQSPSSSAGTRADLAASSMAGRTTAPAATRRDPATPMVGTSTP